MKKNDLEFKVLIVVICIVGCTQGFINFDFKEFGIFISFAAPLIYGHWLYGRRQKSDENNQGGET